MLHKEIEHERTRYNPVVGCCEYDYELTGTKKGSQVVKQPLSKDPAPMVLVIGLMH
jgi:hypothetical protein